MRPPWPHLGTLVHDEHLRLAIVDDVGDLWTGEVVVDARQIDTDLHGCQVQLDEAHFVRQDDCYPIASLQTETAQTVREPVGALLQLAEGERVTFSVDDREPFRHGIGNRPETNLCRFSHVSPPVDVLRR